MEEFVGKKYELVNSEHFDKLLIFLGFNFIQRQIAAALKPIQYLTHNDDGTYSLYFKTFVTVHKVKFTPGVEFTESKPDGLKLQAFITFDGNKIKHNQVDDNGRTVNHVYEFFANKMIITTTAVGLEVVVKRFHKLVE